ncbi:MAG: MoaD/ThiS family protein [Pseudomonadota bacterium]
MSDISVEVWLYGPLARYGKEADQGSFANLQMSLPQGSTMADLLQRLEIHDGERGITFINGELSAMPGLKPDLKHILNDGDRVGIFHPQSMWPFQYRHGVKMTDEMSRVVTAEKDSGLHHTYE